MNEKTILLGLHSPIYGPQYLRACEAKGYSVDLVTTLDQMLEKAREREYQRYLMDANLGQPNSPSANSAVMVYELVKPRVEAGLAKFLAVALNQKAVDDAQNKGVPAALKEDARTTIDFLT